MDLLPALDGTSPQLISRPPLTEEEKRYDQYARALLESHQEAKRGRDREWFSDALMLTEAMGRIIDARAGQEIDTWIDSAKNGLSPNDDTDSDYRRLVLRLLLESAQAETTEKKHAGALVLRKAVMKLHQEWNENQLPEQGRPAGARWIDAILNYCRIKRLVP